MIKKRIIGIIFCIAIIIFVFLYIHFSNLHETFGDYNFLDLTFPVAGNPPPPPETRTISHPVVRVTTDASSVVRAYSANDNDQIDRAISTYAVAYNEPNIDFRPIWYNLPNATFCEDATDYMIARTRTRYPKCPTGLSCGQGYGVNAGLYNPITNNSTNTIPNGPDGAILYRCTNPYRPWHTLASCPQGYELKNGYEGTIYQQSAWTKGCKRIEGYNYS